MSPKKTSKIDSEKKVTTPTKKLEKKSLDLETDDVLFTEQKTKNPIPKNLEPEASKPVVKKQETKIASTAISTKETDAISDNSKPVSTVLPVNTKEINNNKMEIKTPDQTTNSAPKNNDIKPASGQEPNKSTTDTNDTILVTSPLSEATQKSEKPQATEANEKPVSLTSAETITPVLSPEETKIKTQEAKRIQTTKQSLKKIQIWEGSEGSSLKRTLTRWTEQVNVKLTWNTKLKPDLEMDMYVSGTLENALKTLFTIGVKDGPQYSVNIEKGELIISD